MKYTDNYKFKKPDIVDTVDINDLNANMDSIDELLKPTIDSGKNIKSDSGKVSDILSSLANRIKTITGKNIWHEDPATTLETANAHINAAAPHKGHATTSDLNALAGTGRTTETVKGVNDALNNLGSELKTQLSDKLGKIGGTFTGKVNFNGIQPLNINNWGDISANNSGSVLLGQNCYTNKDNSKFYYSNTHPSLGARGVFISWSDVFVFSTGNVATTKDQEFSPNFVKIANMNDLNNYYKLEAHYQGDMNDLFNIGVYNCQLETCKNKPQETWGTCYVSYIAHNLWIQQLWIGQYGDIYVRHAHDGGGTRVWNTWRKIIDQNGGTLTGVLTAQSNTSYTTKQVRNIILSPNDVDINQMGEGDIWVKYK